MIPADLIGACPYCGQDHQLWMLDPMLFDLRPGCQHTGAAISVSRKGGRYGSGPRLNQYATLAECQRLLGIDWTSQRELGDAVPPAYTYYLGGLLKAEIDKPAGIPLRRRPPAG